MRSDFQNVHLVVDINVPEKPVPGVRDVLTSPPQMSHLAAKSLNVAKTPGAQLEGDVSLLSNRLQL